MYIVALVLSDWTETISRWIEMFIEIKVPMFHFQLLDPLSSFSVGYKSESNNANDSKKEDLSQLFCI